MSLDICVHAVHTGQPAAPKVSLEDDGYYWFLHPWLERLREQSGKYLDLYGDTFFTADDFPRLRRLLDEALTTARSRPAQWQVYVGTQTRPVEQAVYKSVQRERLITLLSDLRTMIDHAERCGGRIECIGD